MTKFLWIQQEKQTKECVKKTHIIEMGIECYSKACYTAECYNKKSLYFRNGNTVGTNDRLERQMGSLHDMS